MKLNTKQKGFSFVEVILSVGIMMTMFSVIMTGLSSAMQFKSRLETESIMKSMRESLYAAYKDNVGTIDDSNAAEIRFSATSAIAPVVADATSRRCPSTGATFAPMARYLVTAAARSHLDGFNHPMCLYVTTRQTINVEGTNLVYHTIALVSSGANGVIEAGTTFNTGTGVLALAGDDEGTLLDGRTMAQERYKETVEKISRVANVYQAYFQTRYQADPGRNALVDYFAAGTGNWDNSGGTMPIITTLSSIKTPVGGIRPYQVLGLSINDVTDAFGEDIQIQNSGNNTRNPGNASADQRLPPYTAIISADLPGGNTVVQTVVGTL